MKTKPILTLLFCWFSLSTFAQTKFIAHKSHSGNMANFKFALKSDKFGLKFSNFGEAPEPEVKNAQLDTIIFLSENTAVMVTSTYCKWRKTDKQSNLWTQGRDTLHNHALFNKKHSVKHIKKVLKKKYHFKNPVKNIKFVDYSKQYKNKLEKSKKRNTILFITIITGVLLLISTIIWRLKVYVMSDKP